ncbi:hypothetical protein Rsub_09329 [Raphidocelis subcapitata]|uniref:Uncharacterized protein n=1 Tax=Raphidocelis subcapitata TaxID=307507 RepID=A0A2V0PA24_9CHLO|nr:hypothetical protein Rsub_09329 [Raphidocelis subcapitata]|eukprot:GBF96696.1 hypothetical protein Rsub_09329 [Raphidocelis subcapitata]
MLRSAARSAGLRALQAAVAEQQCLGARCLATEAAAQASSSSPAAAAASSGGAIYAAVVVERLPVVRSPAPEWEAEYQAWAEQRRLSRGFYKEYPASAKKVARQKDEDTGAFNPVPTETAADASGDARTMRRRLRDKLVLLVKQPAPAGDPLGRPVGGGGAGSGGGGAAGGGWSFPAARRAEGETLRAAAERALREAVGVAEVFFVGNAPMGHFPLGGSTSGSGGGGGGGSSGSSGGGSGTRALHTSAAPAAADGGGGSAAAEPGQAEVAAEEGGDAVFFMLAQVVNDPWEVDLGAGSCSDAVWVAPDELPGYIGPGPLADLAQRML